MLIEFVQVFEESNVQSENLVGFQVDLIRSASQKRRSVEFIRLHFYLDHFCSFQST